MVLMIQIGGARAYAKGTLRHYFILVHFAQADGKAMMVAVAVTMRKSNR